MSRRRSSDSHIQSTSTSSSSSTSKPNSLYGINIKSAFKKPNELIKYLKDLHENLKSLNQDVQSTPTGFLDTVQYILQAKLLENSDKKVKLLTCCCLVDIFRIYAPEAPYKDSDMLFIFDAIILQIRSLQTAIPNSEDEKWILYILQSLSSVKSCVIPVIMAQNGISQAMDTVYSLFAALIDSVRPDHSNEVLASCAEIIQCCIIEYEGVAAEWLDALLIPLLPVNKSENPTAYKIVAGVLRLVQPLVQASVTTLVHDILVNPNANFRGRPTELADEIFPLIYELHLVAPPLLFGVIPELTILLKVDEDEVRARIVKLLARLYTSDHFDYVIPFTKDFREFTSRMNDRNSSIRNEMVETVISILSIHPETKSFLEELIVKKLRDPDEEIRIHALTKLLESAQENLLHLSKSTIIEICERVKDKRFEVRKIALTGLGKLYARHISSKLPPISEIDKLEDLAKSVPTEIFSRLEDIPNVVLKAWGYPDFPTRYLVLTLLQEYLLPRNIELSEIKSPDESMKNQVRATSLLLLFRLMKEEVDKASFSAIMNYKTKIADELKNFVRLKGHRNSLGSTDQGSADEPIKVTEMRQALFNLTGLIPISDKKQSVFDRLISNKDKYVLKLFDNCLNANDNIQAGLKHRDDLLKRLDSKSLLGEYFGMVYDCAAHFLYDCTIIRLLLETAQRNDSMSFEISEILAFISRFPAKAFASSADSLTAWADIFIPQGNEKGKEKQLKDKIFANFVNISVYASKWFSSDSRKEEYAQKLIKHAAKVEDPFVCLKLGEVLSHLAFLNSNLSERSTAFDVVIKYVKQISSKRILSVNNQRLLANLCFLSSLLRLPPVSHEKVETLKYSVEAIKEALTPLKESLTLFIYEELFGNDCLNVEAKSVGLRILANLICCEDDIARIGGGERNKIRKDVVKLSGIIFECIEHEGKVFLGDSVDDSESQLQLLEASAIDGIILCRIQEFSDSMTTIQWQELAWTLVNADLEVKKNLLQLLSNTIQIHPVNLKFLAFPCLFAKIPEMAETAQRSLVFAIKRLRRTHEEISSRLITAKDERERENLKFHAQNLSPERILPYLLYLLSYHPDFPSSMVVQTDEDKRRIKDVIKCVQMLIFSLQSTLRNEMSNLPYLFKQLNLIVQKHVDKEDPDNVGLHYVTRLTIKLLNDQVKTADNVQVYPGEIILPEELFQRTEDGRAQKMLNKAAVDTYGLDEADKIIDKVIQATHNKGRKAIASPSGKILKSKLSPEISKRAKEKKELKPKKGKEIQQEAPSRTLPKRSTKTVTSYAEVEEDESEVERWNEEAAKKPFRKSDSRGERKDENSQDLFETRRSISPIGKISSSPSSVAKKNGAHDELFFDLELSSPTDNPLSPTAVPKSSGTKRKLSAHSKLNHSQDTSTDQSSIYKFSSLPREDENSTDELFEDKPKNRKRKISSASSSSMHSPKENNQESRKKQKLDEPKKPEKGKLQSTFIADEKSIRKNNKTKAIESEENEVAGNSSNSRKTPEVKNTGSERRLKRKLSKGKFNEESDGSEDLSPPEDIFLKPATTQRGRKASRRKA